MKQTFLLACCAAAVAAAGCVAQAQDVTLVEDGVAKCRVEIPAKPSATESFLAKEIAKYVEISTGAKIEAERRGGESCYPIELRTDAALKPESFVIETRADGMTISGGDDLGLLYGAYELLKRHFGMRWLIPGEEGEYCVLKGKTVRVPVVASGGAGCPEHLRDAFNLARADAAIVAGMLHTGEYSIRQIKDALDGYGIPMRMRW